MKDNTYVIVMLIFLAFFSISGLICGFIMYSNIPKSVRDNSTIHNCFIYMIVAIVFIIVFNMVYLVWHLMHNHKNIGRVGNIRNYPYSPGMMY